MKMKLGILITAYNEEPRIKKVLNKLTNKTVILVNDGSTDGTENIIDSYDNVIKISYKKNQGKGYALQRGLSYAKKNKFDRLILMDADGQHNPIEIKKFIKKLDEGYDFISGSRFIKNNSNVPFGRRIILFGGNIIEKVLIGINLTDAHNGYRAMSKTAIKKIKITENRMAYASELMFEVIHNDLKYTEVPVKIKYTRETLKKGTGSLLTGFKILFRLIGLKIRYINKKK
jgi:glycosyltransferase involved in cell wall biosynthesis|tara:strand:+ start:326 stop:1015 length:690 start_codon:yes stop_codon:yes gene_type:complete